MGGKGWTIAGGILLANLALLISDYRVLINERIVRPGQHLVVGEWGDLGKNGASSIVCTYWTGRSVTPIVWWYGGGFMSKDSCPFLHKAG